MIASPVAGVDTGALQLIHSIARIISQLEEFGSLDLLQPLVSKPSLA
jgi:hypothetical protein